MHEVILAHGLLGLRQHGGRAGHIAPGQFQAGEKHLADNEPVNHSVILPRQLKALLPVLLGGIQVVPFVADAGQAKIRFAGIRRRLITNQLQDTPVGLGRQIELVFQFLYLAQAGCSQYGDEDIPGRLADRYGFGIGPAGRGTVSLEMVGKPQRPGSLRCGKTGCRGADTPGRGAPGQ